MNPQTLETAITEATQFLIKARTLRDALAAREKLLRKEHLKPTDQQQWISDPIKQSSACRRASMDLSRALSELRKSG